MEQKAAARILDRIVDREKGAAAAAGIVGKMAEGTAAQILSRMEEAEKAGTFVRRSAARILVALETQTDVPDAVKGRSWVLRSYVPRDAAALITTMLEPGPGACESA